ncbi:MAG: shikimate kinase [Eubacteriales bacterium]|nr:shikimate kinase [Eubacteriales bacterium]
MGAYGLIGERLGHSFSPRLHALLGGEGYALWPMPPDALDDFLAARAFDGANVTIPYKQAVIPHCAELGETARRIGSVNTLVRRADGTLFGDNTDAFGFALMAGAAGIEFKGKKALVLGSGGTSLTACDVVRQAGGTPIVISRHGENNYDNLDRHADAEVLVNATPVGMYPRVFASPVDLRRFPRLSGVLDVIYNPLRTLLLQQAEALGILCSGGLRMLVGQAVRARELFTGEPIPAPIVQSAYAALRAESLNLVLIGMPGSGKSTLGRLLAQQLGRPLVDVDSEIEAEAGRSIPDIFAQDGEGAFRDLESAVLEKICLRGGQIIATGGGAPLRERNRQLMRMNGFVALLERPVELLSTGGRPLSKGLATLRRMKTERAQAYAACADFRADNSGARQRCADAIKEAFHEALCY